MLEINVNDLLDFLARRAGEDARAQAIQYAQIQALKRLQVPAPVNQAETEEDERP